MHPIELQLKSITQNLTEKNTSILFIRNALKEYLQDLLLFIIYNDPELKNLIFYGGTCLRKFYDLNRLSEDLDFESHDEINLDKIAETIHEWFRNEKFSYVDTSVQKGDHINRITAKFKILHNLALSDHESEKLHVKVEINDKPTGKYPTILTPYGKGHYSMIVQHYNLETLMAGKMLACIDRVFKKGDTGITIKGRDYYDLIWYMQRDTQPNEKCLTDANPKYSVSYIFSTLDEKVSKITKNDLLLDLEPFFIEGNFIREWCKNFHKLYERYRENYK